jgi:predicted AlkP superfamily pyrophosphatase or phosphodiesterase
MKYLLVFLLLMSGAELSAQSNNSKNNKPKLVVGIVVDQMRQEYLYRFESKFSEGGFKRLMNEGFMLRNAHYNYAPTVTGPGHASVYSGTTPAMHGIIANDWYDKDLKKTVNCVSDPKQKVVGSPEGKGAISPWRMLTSTVTDELELFTQRKSKIIGVSVKDRGAVLPAGHMADAAYWYDSKSGTFVTSTYYMNVLPDWLNKFNSLKLPDQYLSKVWNTFFPIDQYTASGPDESPYEMKYEGKEKSTFPYDLKALRKMNNEYDLLVHVPFGNDFLTDMAKATLEGEKLGQHTVPDFLAVSYSTTDIIGHAVGPNAVEIQDTYIRLDRNIEDLLKTLDAKVGAGNYTVFLSADHAVADVAQYLKDNKMPAGYFNYANVQANLNEYLRKYFPGKDVVEEISGDQVYLNQSAFQSDPSTAGVQMIIATELAVKFLMAQEGVANVYSESLLRQGDYSEGGIKGAIIRGYHAKRSGDIVITLESGWYSATRVQGTTHGSAYRYDTHVPILFYGARIPKGSSVRYHTITDIAPTISAILEIKFPSGSTGQPVEEIFEK